MPPSPRILVEQAIARGDDLDAICESLTVDARFVDEVLRRMEAFLAETPAAKPKPAPKTAPTRTPPRRRPDSQLRPHGTHAAYVRHRLRGEDACDDCKAGEARFQCARQRARRARARRAA